MSLLIKREGLLTTLQDLGRAGLRQYGSSPGGAMDRTAARLLNLLVGNRENSPVLEMHFPAAEILFEDNVVFALGGGNFGALLDGEAAENWRTFRASASSVLKFTEKITGARCYFAASGLMYLFPDDSEPTAAPSKQLRIRKNTRIGLQNALPFRELGRRRVASSLITPYGSFPTVRVVRGGDFGLLLPESHLALTREVFAVTKDSNRMGYRLSGPAIEAVAHSEMVSAAVTFGTVQLLPNGQLIILMADHQTSGGYPRIANVIGSDISLIAQLNANDKIAFEFVEIDEAERIALRSESDILRFRIGCGLSRYA